MPTGYTSDIAKGITFKQFALRCARAFGALITMRDEPHDAPIPEKFEQSDYYKNKIDATLKEYESLVKMNDEDLQAETDRFNNKELKYYEERLAEKAELKKKYETMLDEVSKYDPPSPDHIEYKDFMKKQIEQSIDFDCSTSYLKKPEPLTAKEYKEKRLEQLNKDVSYYTKQDNEEAERVESRNVWISQLRSSLENYK